MAAEDCLCIVQEAERAAKTAQKAFLGEEVVVVV